MKRTRDRRVLLALGVAVLIWASAFAGIRAGLEAYTSGHLALLVVYALVRRMPPPAVRDLPAILLGGFLGFTVYHAGLAFGEVTVEAGPPASSSPPCRSLRRCWRWPFSGRGSG